METHSSILAWRIPWTEEPGGLQSTGSQRVRHYWATNTLNTLYHVPCPCVQDEGKNIKWIRPSPPLEAYNIVREELGTSSRSWDQSHRALWGLWQVIYPVLPVWRWKTEIRAPKGKVKLASPKPVPGNKELVREQESNHRAQAEWLGYRARGKPIEKVMVGVNDDISSFVCGVRLGNVHSSNL